MPQIISKIKSTMLSSNYQEISISYKKSLQQKKCLDIYMVGSSDSPSLTAWFETSFMKTIILNIYNMTLENNIWPLATYLAIADQTDRPNWLKKLETKPWRSHRLKSFIVYSKFGNWFKIPPATPSNSSSNM